MADKPVTRKEFDALEKKVDELRKAFEAEKKEIREMFKLEKIWTHAMFDQHSKVFSQHAELINKLQDQVFK